jgi:hypothetical protein
MSYTMADGRRQLLDDLAAAAEQLGEALAGLTEAYEHLDDDAADRLEAQLFRPVQAAYGTAKRSHTEFAARYEVSAGPLGQPRQGLPTDARAAIERAVDAIQGADVTLANLQDSLLPVEVGDPELRAGLSQVRSLIAPLPARSRDVIRTLGR